jgi:predicted DNA-binding protein
MNKNDEKMLGGISRQLSEAALSVQKQADKMSLNVKSTLAEIAQRLSELTDREAKEKAQRSQEWMERYFLQMNRYRELLERVLKGEDVADKIRAALTVTF